MKIINESGKEIDFDVAVALMDDDVREAVHSNCAPCTEQEFFDAYCDAHAEKFHEKFECAKENPVL